jgi:hypothetical protein
LSRLRVASDSWFMPGSNLNVEKRSKLFGKSTEDKATPILASRKWR